MEVLFWSVVFIISLVVLVKSADWFTESAERIGLGLGLSPFIVGITIVALGTSFPELITGLAAVFEQATEIVAANAVGSNIANILLVVGLSAAIGGRLMVRKSLIDLDLPLLAISTALMWGTFVDGAVNFSEGLLIVLAYGVYFASSIFHRAPEKETQAQNGRVTEVLPDRIQRRHGNIFKAKAEIFPFTWKDFARVIIGVVGLIYGAKYLIDAVINIAGIFSVSTGLVSITAVALGTSLPELFVSVGAVIKKKYEVALGNVFGSNVFNALLVVGVPAMLKPLSIDHQTLTIGLPVMLLATLLFIFSGISRRIYRWEGMLFLLGYFLFLAKLFDIF